MTGFAKNPTQGLAYPRYTLALAGLLDLAKPAFDLVCVAVSKM